MTRGTFTGILFFVVRMNSCEQTAPRPYAPPSPNLGIPHLVRCKQSTAAAAVYHDDNTASTCGRPALREIDTAFCLCETLLSVCVKPIYGSALIAC